MQATEQGHAIAYDTIRFRPTRADGDRRDYRTVVAGRTQEANAPKKKTAAPAKGGSKRAGPPAAAAKAPKRANAKGW